MSSDNIHPSNLRECCICLEQKLNKCFVTYSCYHNTVCLSCFFKQNYPVLYSSIFTCPLCRKNTSYINLRYNSDYYTLKQKNYNTKKMDVFIYYDISSKNDMLYEKIRKYITNVKNDNNTNNIIKSIILLYNSIEQDKKYPVLFTVDQVENLLTIMIDKNMNKWDNSGYKLFNLLVSLCRYPWKVDVKLGSHGVCYHGNLGKTPDSLHKLCELIEYNQEFLTAEQGYF